MDRRFYRTAEDRDDTGCRTLQGYSSLPSELVAGHEERILGHIGMVHNEAGPIPKCSCQICRHYWLTRTCGPEHESAGCHCYICLKYRYLERKKISGKEIADNYRKKALLKTQKYDPNTR